MGSSGPSPLHELLRQEAAGEPRVCISLACVLSVLWGIEQSGLSAGLKKALAYSTVEMPMRGGDDIAGPWVSYCKVGGLEAYEEAISAVRVLYGEVGVAEAVKKLRASGHVELARRLRRACSSRDKQAHPDPRLARELLLLASVVEGNPLALVPAPVSRSWQRGR